MGIDSFFDSKISLKTVIFFGSMWLIFASTVALYFFGGVKEGFDAVSVGIGSVLNYKMGNGIKGSWENEETMSIKKSDVAKDEHKIETETPDISTGDMFLSNLEHNIAGKDPSTADNLYDLTFFKDNAFSPDCCPSNYTSSGGCACISPEQIKFLGHRAGNNTLVSDF